MQRQIANLSPLGVVPEFQRRGIGTALVQEVTARADSRGESLVVLEGKPEFYGRLGFEHSVPCGIHIALLSWARPEAAQVLRLSNYDPSIRGHVSYPPAFDEVTAQLAQEASIAALTRRAISSGGTSSMCVWMYHPWPNGSRTLPARSP
jgi:hypothetical protein